MKKNINSIYGVNLKDDVNPLMVRDAILKCFFEAERDVIIKLFQKSDFETSDNIEIGKKHVEIIIKKIFEDVDGDFDNPSKENLIDVVNKCKEYACLFRNKEIIEKHANEIMILIDRLN